MIWAEKEEKDEFKKGKGLNFIQKEEEVENYGKKYVQQNSKNYSIIKGEIRLKKT